MLQAKPLSRDALERMTWGLRQALDLTEPYLELPYLLEWALDRIAPGFEFDVLERVEMGPLHGAVDPHRRTLSLREDVYLGLLEGKGRDRFTASHEMGHAVLHGTLNRVRSGERVEIFCDPEWQANYFAGALLMPRHMMAVAPSIREIMSEFGVTEDAAKVRCRVLKLRLPF